MWSSKHHFWFLLTFLFLNIRVEPGSVRLAETNHSILHEICNLECNFDLNTKHKLNTVKNWREFAEFVRVSIFPVLQTVLFWEKIWRSPSISCIIETFYKDLLSFFSIPNCWVLNWEISLGVLKIKTIKDVCEFEHFIDLYADYVLPQSSDKVRWICYLYLWITFVKVEVNNLPILDNISAPVSNSHLCMANILTKGNKDIFHFMLGQNFFREKTDI